MFKEGLIRRTSNASLLASAGDQRISQFDSPMSQPDQKSLLVKRAAQKRAARQEDLARLEGGMSPESLQRENSIFPKSFFENARISNLKQAVGR
jgi:hypothetical protein